MRVQCDVCENSEAAVMCCADEAALCEECDVKVHAANKLAVKHERVPLIKDFDSPRCDICQEKTGFFFCLQDRALLCRNCDMSIHTANALSSSHQRFLVTGIRVALEAIAGKESAVELPEESLRSVASNVSLLMENTAKASRPPLSVVNSKEKLGMFPKPPALDAVSGIISNSSTPSLLSGVVSSTTTLSSVSGIGCIPATTSSASCEMQMIAEPNPASQNGYGNFFKRNSISEFLTEAIPGWRVDELLNIQDLAGGYTLGDIASSKADAENLGEFDWTADLSLFDEQVCAQSFHEVPELPFGSFSFPRSGRPMINPTKGKGKQDMTMFPEFEDSFTVPDLGLRSLPDSPPFIKRRRI
ncbi:hypothetical protein O6H91_02G007200 [Diphasiastrum complanatum]|uniref:Uncharacterized protein n=1 Tax=Diphasiastrum complanatum TaxID=34168 RepID=A0ACC2ECB9_DIPCM|nr:hypothetical protein O6H91_Y564100 [Diphasiastrum complanatum]KAJ7564209.1 hypothetical protein O6H91_02G007200 [Diphasiastrum complanatum]